MATKRLIQLLSSKTNTEENICKTIYKLTKLNKKQFEEEFIRKLKKHVKWPE